MRKYDTILALAMTLLLTAGPIGCVAGGAGVQQLDGNASLRVPDANVRAVPPAYWQPISGPDLPVGGAQTPTIMATAGRVTPPAQIGA
jgi:hypothetical protein